MKSILYGICVRGEMMKFVPIERDETFRDQCISVEELNKALDDALYRIDALEDFIEELRSER